MIKSVYSTEKPADAAADDIKTQLQGFDVRMLIFFASWEGYAHDEIAACMYNAFPGAVVFGCSSHAEINNTETLTCSVTAMAFSSETVSDAKTVVLTDLKSGVDMSSVMARFSDYYNTPMTGASYKQFGGIALIDGLSMKEEEIMEKTGARTNIPFVGGSASDALWFDATYIYADGKAYKNAAVLAVYKPVNGIDIIKTQSVDIKDAELTVTKADTSRRAVIEFDNIPAVIRYAEVLGVPVKGVEEYFFANPVGLMLKGDVYIRNCQRIEGDSLIFYCGMPEGAKMRLLKIKDIIPDTKAAVLAMKQKHGSIKGIIDFRCAFRTIQLENEGTTEAYGEIFDGIPTIGFSTYGEEYIGHMNQTSTMIVFL